jgi:hypothetical protein
VGGYYVEKDATAHTYTASRDTYVDLSQTGIYAYSAVANGATEPATTANSIRLAKVVTGATDVTSVEDKRVTSINVANKDDHALYGMNLIVVSPDCTSAGLVTVDAGVCYVDTTRVEKNTKTTLDIDVANDFHDGATDAKANAWWYVGVDTGGNVKLLGANPPDKPDADGNTEGIKKYWYDSANTKYWRVIGVFRCSTVTNISYDYYQIDENIYYNYPQIFNCGTSTSWSEVDIGHLVPPIAEEATISASTQTANETAAFRNVKSKFDYYSCNVARFETAEIIQQVGTIYITSDANVSGIDYKSLGGNRIKGFINGYRLKIR